MLIMRVEKYLIELTNGEFASFIQESDTDILVVSTPNFYAAEFMSKDFAETQMHDLVNKDCGWNYYGDCLEPKAIRKIEIELF